MPGKGITREEIVSITPAVGWYAKYAQDGGTVEYCRVLAWGLVEREYIEDPTVHRHLVGFDQDSEGLTELCDSASNFAGYINAADPGFDMSLVYPPPSTVQVVPGMYSYTYRPETIVLATETGLTPIGELVAATEALFEEGAPVLGTYDVRLFRVSNALDAFKKSCSPKA
jgi:hypothetical protein